MAAPESSTLPWGTIVTALTTLASVWIGSRLSSGQATRAKLWDLRREAYGTILSSLSGVERILDVADEYIAEDEHRYFEGEASDNHNKRISELMKIAYDTYAKDYLILTANFISIYDKMSSEITAGSDEIPPDAHEIFAKAIRKYRPLLLAQGRKEIMRGQPWHRRARLKLVS